MPVTVPETLRPFHFHRVVFDADPSDLKNLKEATAECPFCSKEGKFSVNVKTSKWRCFYCEKTGNEYTFITEIWKLFKESSHTLSDLAFNRKLDIKTLKSWGVCKDGDTSLVPCFNAQGNLTQLHRYILTNDGRKLIPTPNLGQKLFGLQLFGKSKEVVYICEGPWDAMKMWETLGKFKENESGIEESPTLKMSLLSGANVLGVPGCKMFEPSWRIPLKNKKVYLVYDNDHPRRNPKTKKMIPPAGLEGT